MDGALDDVAFLANTGNRVAVLRALVEAPRSRDELREHVDASRVTVARVLRELEARDWIEGSGQEYAATPLGEWVSEEFTGLVEEIEAERRLRDPLQWVPFDLLTFDVRRLRDAEIVRPDESDVTGIVRRIVEFHRSGDRIRGMRRGIAPTFVENQYELAVHGDTRVELVLTPDALDVVRTHPTSARQVGEMLDEENVRYFVADEVPISVGIVDEVVGICLTDEQGVLKGALFVDDETVRAWAVDLFETWRERGRPV